MTRLHHRRHHGQVFSRQLLALLQRSYAVPDLQSGIPQAGHKTLEPTRCVNVWRVLRQDEHVYIRLREQLTSAVSTDGN